MKKKEYIYYMDLARRTAQNSYAVRKKVGAILVRDRRILADAWNGTPPGWDNTCEEEVNGLLVTKPIVLHAEDNLMKKMANCHEIIAGASMFITLNPCPPCAVKWLGTGLHEIVYDEEYRISDGIEYLRNDGIIVRSFDEVMRSFENDWYAKPNLA